MNRTATPGRQAERGERATESVRIPLTPDELAWIDAHRGQTPRATWVRARLFERVDADGGDPDAWREGVE